MTCAPLTQIGGNYSAKRCAVKQKLQQEQNDEEKIRQTEAEDDERTSAPIQGDARAAKMRRSRGVAPRAQMRVRARFALRMAPPEKDVAENREQPRGLRRARESRVYGRMQFGNGVASLPGAARIRKTINLQQEKNDG